MGLFCLNQVPIAWGTVSLFLIFPQKTFDSKDIINRGMSPSPYNGIRILEHLR